MEYGIVYPNVTPLTRPGIPELVAREAERLGFDSVFVNDHLIIPSGHTFLQPEIYDPLMLLATMAAVTERIRIGTSIVVLPLRNPVVTARAIATVDHMSGGRVIFGVGVGWLEEEFAAVGVDFHQRGRITDEYLDLMNHLWTSDPCNIRYGTIDVPNVRMLPQPAQKPLPVWVSGMAPAAIERAARLGTGWHPLNLLARDFADGVETYRRACKAAGRPTGEISLRTMHRKAEPGTPFTGSAAEIARSIDEFGELGLEHIVFSPFAKDVNELVERMEFIANDVRLLTKARQAEKPG